MEDVYALYQIVDGNLHIWSRFETKREALKEARKELKMTRWCIVLERWVATDEVTSANRAA